MALTLTQQVRLLVQDNAVGLYFVSDDEVLFFLDRNNQSVNRTALEVAKVILLQLSLRSNNETVDIFSLSGSKAAEQYRLALQLFIRSPTLNPIFQNITAYAGGISKADIQANIDNADNNYISTPLNPETIYSTDPFGVYNE